jgi:hypothetical protein
MRNTYFLVPIVAAAVLTVGMRSRGNPSRRALLIGTVVVWTLAVVLSLVLLWQSWSEP